MARPLLDRPIFVLGCGRSGTTILGTSIGRHRDVAYLNEPFHLWFQAFPQSDIWTAAAGMHGGRVALDARDWTKRGAAVLTQGFAAAAAQQRRPRFCEKLPINSFRVRLINRIFPDALFIYTEREAMAVARSIDDAERNFGNWFGINGYKWQKLAELADQNDRTRGLAALCVTPLQKGLLEWILSTEAATSFLDTQPTRRVMRVTYRNFTADPAGVLAEIETFCGLRHDPAAAAAVAATVRADRRPQQAIPDDPVIHALLAVTVDRRREAAGGAD